MTRPIGSWERPRFPYKDVHAPAGVDSLRRTVSDALIAKYAGIDEMLYRWDGMDKSPWFEDALKMSQDTVPEVPLFRNGQVCVFETAAQLHILPLTYDGGINIYGKMSHWHPVPVGWDDPNARTDAMRMIHDLDLTYDNSVIIRNDLFGRSDLPMIESMVSLLVDNTLTLNQLQLLAKSPYIFNVTENNLLSAKQFFLSICQDKPVIYTNADGERIVPQTEQTPAKIDPALFDLFDHWETLVLEQLGIPCVPITKRAQQTVSEISSNDEKIRLRRLEKWAQRNRAANRINEMWGTNLKVVSVIDEDIEKSEMDANGTISEA